MAKRAKLRGTRIDEMVGSPVARAIRLPERMANGLLAEGDVARLGSRLGSEELSVASAKTETVNDEGIESSAQSHIP